MRRLKVDKIKKDEYYMKKRLLSGLLAVMMVCLSIMTVASAAPATHTVVAGDSLSSLAQRYLGSADRWKEIYEANRDVISDPNSIYVGQQLRIPGSSSTAPDEGTKPAPDKGGSTVVPTPEVDKSTQPRVIITTDLEIDDMNGILLSLLFSNDYDLAGIVWTAGKFHFSGDGEHTLQEAIDLWYPGYEISCEATTAGGTIENPGQAKEMRPADPTFLERAIDVWYRADYEHLSQNDPNYPTPDYLLSITKTGNIAFEGDYHEDTEGSDLIRACILDDDPRPLYIQHWGGINTTVRALVSIYEEYHETEQWPEIQAKVVDKVRISGNGEDNCRAYSKIDELYPGLKDSDWTGFGGFTDFFAIYDAPETLRPYYQAEWLTDAFKFDHGRLMEHFLLMNDGQVIYGEPFCYQYGLVNYIDWPQCAKEGWANPMIGQEGGLDFFPLGQRSEYDTYDWCCAQFGMASFVDLGLRQGVKNSETRYVEAMFEDLAARADWAVGSADVCNHAPVITAAPQDVTAKAGETVTLTAAAGDPDGDALTTTWWVPASACTYQGAPIEDNAPQWKLSAPNALTTQFTVPEDAQAGDIFVVNLEVQDAGVERPMTRFAQVVITVEA